MKQGELAGAKVPGATRWLLRSGEWRFFAAPSEQAPRACVVLSLNVSVAHESPEHAKRMLAVHLNGQGRQPVDALVVAHELGKQLALLPPGAPEAWLERHFNNDGHVSFWGLLVTFHRRELRPLEARVPVPGLDERERAELVDRDQTLCRDTLAALSLLEDEVYQAGIKMVSRKELMLEALTGEELKRLELLRESLRDVRAGFRSRHQPPQTRGPAWSTYKAAVDGLDSALREHSNKLEQVIRAMPDARTASAQLDEAEAHQRELARAVRERGRRLGWEVS